MKNFYLFILYVSFILLLTTVHILAVESLDTLVSKAFAAIEQQNTEAIEKCFSEAKFRDWREFSGLITSVHKRPFFEQMLISTLVASSPYSKVAFKEFSEDKDFEIKMCAISAIVEHSLIIEHKTGIKEEVPAEAISLLRPALDSGDILLRGRAIMITLALDLKDTTCCSLLPGIIKDLKAIQGPEQDAKNMLECLEKCQLKVDEKSK